MYAVFLMESVRCVHCFSVNFHFASFSVCCPIGQDSPRPLNVTTEVFVKICGIDQDPGGVEVNQSCANMLRDLRAHRSSNQAPSLRYTLMICYI